MEKIETNNEPTGKKVSDDDKTSIFKRISDFYSRHFLVLVVIKLIVLGIILRIFVMSSSLGHIDTNSSLSLLMSKDFAHGHFSFFRRGFTIFGTPEIFIGAVVVTLLGVNTFAAHVVPLIFLALTTVVYLRAFLRTPYKDTMRYVIATLWIWPGYFIWESTHFSGHIAVDLFLQSAVFASAFYAAHSLRNERYLYLCALLSGFAFYVSPLTLIFIIPCAWWIFSCAPNVKKKVLPAIGLFIVGSLPFWIFNAFHSAASFRWIHNESSLSLENKRVGQNPILQIGGDQSPFSSRFAHNLLGPPALVAFYICTIIVAAFVLYGFYKAMRTRRNDFAFLMALTIAASIVALLIAMATSHHVDASFLIYALPAVVFVAIYVSPNRIIISLIISAMFLSSILSLIAMSHDHNDHQKQLTNLIAALKKNDISYAFAPADIAYRTDALSKDKIIMSPFDGNFFNAQRDNKVRSRVQAIISRTSSSDDQSMVLCIEGYFGAAYRRIEIPHYDIYLVNKDHQDKMFSIVKKCDLAARNSDR